jgi:DNA repair photolyase
MQVFNSFYHEVKGNEAERCHYPTRLDTYGCGCQHNCGYCYARALLAFRGLWNPQSPSSVQYREVVKIVRKLRPNSVIRLGGMTDCFMPLEQARKITLRTIPLLNRRGVHYLIVTKNDLVATDEYMAVLDKRLAHIQVSITSTNDEYSKKLESGAILPEQRIAAVERLADAGFDVQVRLSPFIPQLIDVERIKQIKCDRILVEFLRVNTWIERWVRDTRLPIDLTEYTRFNAGYKHLPLRRKIELLDTIRGGFSEVSVCEDVETDYEYWQRNVNHNPNDCCNLKL